MADEPAEPVPDRGLGFIPDADNGSIPPVTRWFARQWWSNLASGVFAISMGLRPESADVAVVLLPVGAAFTLAGLALLGNLIRERRRGS